MPVYKAEGIVLGRRNLGEADRVLTLLTREHGKLPVKAKAVRKPTSRLSGCLEPFTHARFLLARGRALDVVAQVEVIESFAGLRSDLRHVGYAALCAELTDRLMPEGEPHPEVFWMLLQAQATIASGAPEVGALWYALHLLTAVGYRPVVDRCARCGATLGGRVGWSPEGGTVCEGCGRAEGVRWVSAEGVATLRALLRSSPRSLGRVHLREVKWDELTEAIAAYAEARIEGRLRSLTVVRGLLRAVKTPPTREDILEAKDG